MIIEKECFIIEKGHITLFIRHCPFSSHWFKIALIPCSIRLQVRLKLQDWRPPLAIAHKCLKCHGPGLFPISLTFRKRL